MASFSSSSFSTSAFSVNAWDFGAVTPARETTVGGHFVEEEYRNY